MKRALETYTADPSLHRWDNLLKLLRIKVSVFVLELEFRLHKRKEARYPVTVTVLLWME
jgi:hypothetical protein